MFNLRRRSTNYGAVGELEGWDSCEEERNSRCRRLLLSHGKDGPTCMHRCIEVSGRRVVLRVRYLWGNETFTQTNQDDRESNSNPIKILRNICKTHIVQEDVIACPHRAYVISRLLQVVRRKLLQ